jgi:pimeloyl-ACP methyl ester carboxylesterase
LVPGLGADYRLLEPQRLAFPQLAIPSWISPDSNETLPKYAARLAETVSVSRDRPLILGGVSLGGMLACEMATHLKPDAVVLIASCRSPRAIRPSLYHAGHWLLPFLPQKAWELAKWLAGLALALRWSVPAERRDLAVTMFREMDSQFMDWALRALLHWQPTPLSNFRIHHIHGRRDRLISARRVNADRLIADGGHLINVTHAEQVNAFVSQILESF